MPNPKVGTVTDDIEKAVTESKAGKVEYRTDRQAIVHLAIGKASFDADKLLDNCMAVIEEINRAKPSSAKGRYILSATLTTTMGPGIRVDTSKAKDADTPVIDTLASAGTEGEAEESADGGASEEQSQSDSSATSENTEEPATA
jgi:large subunit ribosomal protein L1